MSDLNVILRDYKTSDYNSCEALVSAAWTFDDIFKPQELANISKCMYTKGSLLTSNFQRVVEVNDKVIGFLFALNENIDKPKHNLLFGLSSLWQLLRVKGMTFKQKRQFFHVLNTHEANRLKVVGRGRSEVVLFVIDPNHQKTGYGKRLLAEFITQCKNSNIQSIIVETNTLEASSFYERVGFKHLGDFDSPLHEYTTKGGQACIYEYTC